MCMTKAAWEQMLFSVDFHLDRQEKQRAACLAARNILEHDISARQKQVLLLYYGEGKKMADIAELFRGDGTLLLAYNAHFDLSFLYYALRRDGDPAILRGKDKLDLLTVYKDRRSYPHKLKNAIESYGLQDRVQNSHRAIDDVKATAAVLLAMEAEKADLQNYVNLFGYNPKYGIQGRPIGSVTYKPQPYDPAGPLYMQ